MNIKIDDYYFQLLIGKVMLVNQEDRVWLIKEKVALPNRNRKIGKVSRFKVLHKNQSVEVLESPKTSMIQVLFLFLYLKNEFYLI